MLSGVGNIADPTILSSAEPGNIDSLEAAAKEFESLFVNELLKSMRQANEAMMSDTESPMMSNDTRFFYSMFDAQLAEHLSEHGGLGIAQALIRQLGD
ncbi:rod-binding protein [Endozoicomonas ascidiicola]|uniref:rod-binding protein n=1 Tax=Endozoicomonas ascidiicola TaxID=1698521 RepID=UPI0008359C24|nr:rod-binding protein [Endozoicomonas ascidiicola]